MKKIGLIIFAIAFVTFSGCKSEDEPESVAPIESKLTEQEEADITFSREQEKLSRDVHLYGYALYGNAIHLKVAGSQQVRMTEVLGLLNEYGIADPASADTGVFSTTELQDRYDALIAQADISLEMALMASMEVEDRALYDIEGYISNAVQEDILTQYDFLYCTSKNHIRWFNPELLTEGGSYTAQFVSQEVFDDILNTPLFQCR